MTIGPHPKGPRERLARQRAYEARSRARRAKAHAVYMAAYRLAHPGLSTPYVARHRAKKKVKTL